jgi:ABC-type cobalamin/Fe3+-siderophores transport system ATPase subunit
MRESAVYIRDLTLHTGTKAILDLGRLEINRREMVGLLGPNGAGKSTLLRSILGLQRFNSGSLRVLDSDIAALGWRGLGRLRRRIGYVPQLLPPSGETPLTVREVVSAGRTSVVGLLKPLRRRDWSIIDEWLERLGMSELAGCGYGEISGGEQRKTLIARAMVQQPEILLLDEPAANLDMGWRERIVHLVQELYESSELTVILVSHQLEVLPACCSRVVVLEEGKISADGPSQSVMSGEMIAELYGPGLTLIAGTDGRMVVVPKEVHHA